VEIEFHRHTPERPWSYADLDRRQREIAARITEGGPGALLISEVSPVITYGRRAGEGELRLPPQVLRAMGIETLATDRGGLATWHGPGQWVVFAVDRLDRLTGDSRGVRKAVEGLLRIAESVARRYAPEAAGREGCELGVWTARGKVASVGVHIQDRVLLHGLSVNGFKTDRSFVGLRPCGLDAPVDYLLPANGVEFDRLGQELADACKAVFWSTEGFRPRSTDAGSRAQFQSCSR
jgi:lipoate-protein ligase B